MKNLILMSICLFLLSCQSPNNTGEKQIEPVMAFVIKQHYENGAVIILSERIYDSEYFYFTTLDSLNNGSPVIGYQITGYAAQEVLLDMFEPAWQFIALSNFDEHLRLKPNTTYSLACLLNE